MPGSIVPLAMFRNCWAAACSMGKRRGSSIDGGHWWGTAIFTILIFIILIIILVISNSRNQNLWSNFSKPLSSIRCNQAHRVVPQFKYSHSTSHMPYPSSNAEISSTAAPHRGRRWFVKDTNSCHDLIPVFVWFYVIEALLDYLWGTVLKWAQPEILSQKNARIVLAKLYHTFWYLDLILYPVNTKSPRRWKTCANIIEEKSDPKKVLKR